MRLLPATRCLATAGLLLVAACSSGSGSRSTKTTPDFAIDTINVLQGAEWKINRAIEVSFNADVDFATVSMNTIAIVDENGGAATGIFSQPTNVDGSPKRRTVRFQPTCPTLDDYSDAGLLPNTIYRLIVKGSESGGVTVRSASGDPLKKGALVTFRTPDSKDPLALFIDTVPGPPTPRVRGGGGVTVTEENATHVVVGGQKVYFQVDLLSQEGRLPAGFELPLNHYSIPENQVQVVVHFNQAVSTLDDNVSSKMIVLEYFDQVWTKAEAEVELLQNCTETGAAVMVRPQGILPQDSQLRVVVRQGFRDITGDASKTPVFNFAKMTSLPPGAENPLFPGVDNPEVDEVLEPFVLGGAHPLSLEDTDAAFLVPRADWGNGELRASFGFEGTGGPGGDFDWIIDPGVELVINTVADTIVGGPDGANDTNEAVIGGVIDVRNMELPASSRIVFVGPNPVTILASGDVTIEGEISVRGEDNPSVTELNTTSKPEPGAIGQAGGGDGGTGSFLTNQSTPRGGRGNGPFNELNRGGEGGETSFALKSKEDRRGAGGGGGRLGPDYFFDWFDPGSGDTLVGFRCQTLIGLDGEPGALGGPLGLGAISQTDRAVGGDIGPSPFVDGDPTNDFFGVMRTDPDEPDGAIIRGELDSLWAGSGGGAGGDAVDSNAFPLTPFDPAGDEKGAGGGGGAGGIQILALGDVVIGSMGQPGSIVADGGNGGAGENVGFQDRVGGGSGGGSGGHIVISSSSLIKIHGRSPTATADSQGSWWYRDNENNLDHAPRPLSALGGQGGAGNGNWGGADEEGQTGWSCDRVPFAFAEGGGVKGKLPPFNKACYNSLPDKADDLGGPVVGAGGDGSPGLIQLHVEDPVNQLEFPQLENEQFPLTWMSGLDVSPVCAPPPVGWTRPNDPAGAPQQLLPFFGKSSRAQSRWIPLGLARVNPPVGPPDRVMLRFEGTEADGSVPRDGNEVDLLPPILGPDPLGPFGTPPYLEADGFTIVFDATALAAADQVYTENPRLLRRSSVVLDDSANAANLDEFSIASASYDAINERLIVSVDPGGPRLDDFVAQGAVRASLVPHWFRVVTSGVLDRYPADTQVQIRFDATKVDPVNGGPDEDNSWSELFNGGDFTPDVADLNLDDWDFVRFQVDFDLDVSGDGVDLQVPRPGLDHLRLPFTFWCCRRRVADPRPAPAPRRGRRGPALLACPSSWFNGAREVRRRRPAAQVALAAAAGAAAGAGARRLRA